MAVLLPDQLLGQVFVRLQLPPQLDKVWQGPNGLVGPPGRCREQQFFQPPVIHVFRQGPRQTGRGGFLQIPVNGCLTNRATAGDLILL